MFFAFPDLQEVQIPTCGQFCMTNCISTTATDEVHLSTCDAIVSRSCTSCFLVLAAKKKVQGLQAGTPQQNIRYTVAACLGDTLILITLVMLPKQFAGTHKGVAVAEVSYSNVNPCHALQVC